MSKTYTVEDFAIRYGCSTSTAKLHIKKNGICPIKRVLGRYGGNARSLYDDRAMSILDKSFSFWVREKGSNLTLSDVASNLSVSKTEARDRLRKSGIEPIGLLKIDKHRHLEVLYAIEDLYAFFGIIGKQK